MAVGSFGRHVIEDGGALGLQGVGRELRENATLEEIGDKFQLTRERVRQIKEKAIRRLRHASRSKPLRSYLG